MTPSVGSKKSPCQPASTGIDRLEQENQELVVRLAEATRTIAELRALVEALRAQLEVADTKIAALSTQFLDLQRDLEFMRMERDDAHRAR